MAVSGTIATTVFDTAKVIELAYRRCRLPPQRISGEMVTLAKDSLFLVLSELASHGFKLWTTEKTIIPFAEGVSYVDAPPGTLEVRDVNIRSLTEVAGTETANFADHEIEFTEAVTITTLGVKFTATATLDLVIDTSNDGSAWTTALDIDSAAYVVGRWYWFDIEGATATTFIRVRESTAAAFTLSDIYAGNTPQERSLSVLNRNVYASFPDKATRGRPSQYWLDRQRDTSRLHVYPVPNADAAKLQVVCFRDRHIMDVGSLTQTLDVPQAWFNAIVAMLATQLALDCQEVDPARYQVLKPVSAEALALAKSNERSRADIDIQADIGSYTRIG